MAGIGFELSRIIDAEQGLLHSIKSYGYAVLVINGPMILCIIAVSMVQLILGSSVYSGFSSDRIIMTVTFAFVIATLLTSVFTLVLTRYVSDCIYEKKFGKIMPSLYGAMVWAGICSILFTAALVCWTGMKLEYAVPVAALYAIVSIIYLEMIYLSAIRNYKAIIEGFLVGNALAVLFILLNEFVSIKWGLQYILFSFNTGFAVTAALLMYQIRQPFGEGSGSLMEWTNYFKRYPSLSLTNLFYYASLYFVCFYYRFKDHDGFTAGFMTMKPEIDIPFYCAVLGFIPGLVYFAVRFETSLHTSCRDFFMAISNNNTYAEIEFKLNSLIMIIKNRYSRIVSMAAAVMLLMLMLPLMVLQVDQTTFSHYILYWFLVMAFSATLLMYVANIVLLYFDSRTSSLIINLFYLTVNIAMTLWLDPQATGLRGLGFMVASVLSMLLAFVIMRRFLKNLNNYAFVMKN